MLIEQMSKTVLSAKVFQFPKPLPITSDNVTLNGEETRMLTNRRARRKLQRIYLYLAKHPSQVSIRNAQKIIFRAWFDSTDVYIRAEGQKEKMSFRPVLKNFHGLSIQGDFATRIVSQID